MTVETRCFIELDDVLGVEFQCHRCGARTLLEKPATIIACPVCKEDWLTPNTEEARILQTFLNTIQNAKAKMEGRAFSLRLQITSPEEPSA